MVCYPISINKIHLTLLLIVHLRYTINNSFFIKREGGNDGI